MLVCKDVVVLGHWESSPSGKSDLIPVVLHLLMFNAMWDEGLDAVLLSFVSIVPVHNTCKGLSIYQAVWCHSCIVKVSIICSQVYLTTVHRFWNQGRPPPHQF